jgi:RNA polymerase sigma-70 factor (ECF subfamily)
VLFREIYDNHFDFVWRNLRRLGVATAELEDRAQEVFIVALRRIDDYTEHSFGPRAWLFQITLRVASDERRRRRRHPIDTDGGERAERESIPPSQEGVMQQKEALATLERALSCLDLPKRAVLLMHEIEEMSAPEISVALSIPLNTVYSRLRNARIELDVAIRKELGR